MFDLLAQQALHFDPRNAYSCSPIYAEVLTKKGHFIMRMLEKRLGKEPLFQVILIILTNNNWLSISGVAQDCYRINAIFSATISTIKLATYDYIN